MYTFLILAFIGGLLVGVAILCYCLRVVRKHQAVAVYSRVTGHVHRIIANRKFILIWPLEQTLFLDLLTQTIHLNANDIITSDLVVNASLDVSFGIDPDLLQKNPDSIPLTAPETTVQSWADHILRALSADYTTTDLLATPIHRARLENLLKQTLQDRVAPLGLRIQTTRLLYYPVPLLLDAKLAAARTEMVAQARARSLELLVAALGSTGDVARILPLELLQRLQGHEETVTAFNLSLPVNSVANYQDPLAIHWVLASH